LAKLEAFYDGLSNCSRRGAKKTLKVLMDCCEQHPAPEEEPATTPNGYANNTTQQQHQQSPQTTKRTLIEPLELVNIGYRVALASAFLSATSKEDSDEHLDIGRFLPSIEDPQQQPGLVALANSLSAYATKRRLRMTRSLTPPNNDKVVELVDEEDVQEWAEQVAPLFASSLDTFTHMIFFPNRPYPPTRTSFDFPSLSHFESTFFPEGSSPLLFSFGCMTPALSGDVRNIDRRRQNKDSAKRARFSLFLTLFFPLRNYIFSFTASTLPLRTACRSIDYKMPCWDMADRL
jgi:hypothetical protein